MTRGGGNDILRAISHVSVQTTLATKGANFPKSHEAATALGGAAFAVPPPSPHTANMMQPPPRMSLPPFNPLSVAAGGFGRPPRPRVPSWDRQMVQGTAVYRPQLPPTRPLFGRPPLQQGMDDPPPPGVDGHDNAALNEYSNFFKSRPTVQVKATGCLIFTALSDVNLCSKGDTAVGAFRGVLLSFFEIST